MDPCQLCLTVIPLCKPTCAQPFAHGSSTRLLLCPDPWALFAGSHPASVRFDINTTAPVSCTPAREERPVLASSRPKQARGSSPWLTLPSPSVIMQPPSEPSPTSAFVHCAPPQLARAPPLGRGFYNLVCSQRLLSSHQFSPPAMCRPVALSLGCCLVARTTDSTSASDPRCARPVTRHLAPSRRRLHYIRAPRLSLSVAHTPPLVTLPSLEGALPSLEGACTISAPHSSLSLSRPSLRSRQCAVKTLLP